MSSNIDPSENDSSRCSSGSYIFPGSAFILARTMAIDQPRLGLYQPHVCTLWPGQPHVCGYEVCDILEDSLSSNSSTSLTHALILQLCGC